MVTFILSNKITQLDGLFIPSFFYVICDADVNLALAWCCIAAKNAAKKKKKHWKTL